MKLPGITGFLSVIAFFFLPATSVVAQSAADDSMLYKRAVSNLVNLYQQSSGDQSGLYNGSQYAGYPFKLTEGHPFFLYDRHGAGSVVYDGVLYENVLMQFDEVQDALIMDSSSRRIQFINDRVTQFTLFNNNFIRIVRDTENTTLVRTGFYEVLYDGKISLLKKEEKQVRDDVTTGELLRFIDIHQYYYIKMNNTYYSISNRKSILSIFKDRKKEVKQFIRKNKLSYRKDRDNMLTKATAWYDQLIK
jgi:hypothetical protein